MEVQVRFDAVMKRGGIFARLFCFLLVQVCFDGHDTPRIRCSSTLALRVSCIHHSVFNDSQNRNSTLLKKKKKSKIEKAPA